MATLNKQGPFFISLTIIAFILIFPGKSFAACITAPGECAAECGIITYKTECGEEFKVGECGKTDCGYWDIWGFWVETECLSCSLSKDGEEGWPEYKCDSPDCDRDILVRKCWAEVEGGPCEDGDCEDEKICVYCEPIGGEICEECQSWQKPVREPPCDATDQCQKWSRYRKPECFCDGECLDAPSGDPRYYNNPLYPLDECNPEAGMDSDNIYLPVKLDWDDVKGWRDGWKEDSECQQVLDCETGDRACYEAPSDKDFDDKSEGLAACKKTCRENCYNGAQAEANKLLPDGYWLTPYRILEFYREECFKGCDSSCREKYETDAGGCTKKCPHLGGGQDYCYLQPEGYAQSYVIKIDKVDEAIRDCEALKKIDELEEKIAAGEEVGLNRQEIKRIREEELEIDKYIEVLPKSEFIPPCSCMFASDETYKWEVRACCPDIKEVITVEEFAEDYCPGCCPGEAAAKKEELRESGIFVEDDLDDVCGPWSNEWQFKTSPAPEPKLPYDPDWVGTGKAENIPATSSIEWCGLCSGRKYPTNTECVGAWAEVGAQYYWDYQDEACYEYSHKLLLYLIENGDKVCHPYATESGEEECNPELLKPFTPGATPNSAYHPTEFSNRIYEFFTKNFIYTWQAATCRDDHTGDCTEFGQEWKFSLADFVLLVAQATSPENDPDGKKPVGFPVSIQWLTSLGTMSSWYEIYEKGAAVPKMTGTTTQPVIVLNYNQLDLETIYKWRVKPCWGYHAEPDKCEGTWSDFFYFKTTGQPPKLISPENNATDVVIPVTFKWESVGGAKSYIFKIDGEEKIVDGGAEITLDYPELLQEASSSWQVKTCAKANGELCGDDWSGEYRFTTFKLGTPGNLWPEDGTTILTTDIHGFCWDGVPGAKYYEFKLQYNKASPAENRNQCLAEEGASTTEIIQKNSLYHQLKCLGEYEWQVRACLAGNCEPLSAGDWSASSTLILVAKETIQEVSEEVLRDLLEKFVYPKIFTEIPGKVSDKVEAIVYQATFDILENNSSTEWLNQADLTPKVPRSILEQVLAEGYIDHDEIAKEVAKRVAEKAKKLFETMADELLERLLARLPEEVLKISDPAEIPGMLTTMIEDEWAELMPGIIDAISDIGITDPQLAEAIEEILLTDGELSTIKGDVIDETLEEAKKAIPGIPAQVEMRRGLVPCGRTSNHPDTPWDETERCQIKHLFIMVYVIIDFFLWKAIPIILALLALASGAIFYFSLQAQNPEPLATVKSLWKAAGIGLVVVLLAWTAISLFLGIFGYRVGIFGTWWQF
ncbi:hypothetical protein AMJ48_00720 [Parcubacteria bacterium DG_74_1]|nr:MAG: hypothetical protein AMJ48_00720 [Parcubacteria bacterium DG_74_1]